MSKFKNDNKKLKHVTSFTDDDEMIASFDSKESRHCCKCGRNIDDEMWYLFHDGLYFCETCWYKGKERRIETR